MAVQKQSLKNLTPGRKGKNNHKPLVRKIKLSKSMVVAVPNEKLDRPSYDVLGITYREANFCHHYLMDYNAANAYIKAGYVAHDSHPYTLLKKEAVAKYIKALQANMEQTSGVTRLRVIRELERMAFTSMAHFRNGSWLTVKEFSELTDDQKACISEITTEVKRVRQEYNETDDVTTTASVEYVKIKLYDKQKALDMLNKMLGFDAPIKIEGTLTTDRKTISDLFPPLPPKI